LADRRADYRESTTGVRIAGLPLRTFNGSGDGGVAARLRRAFGPAAFGPESDLAVNGRAVFGASTQIKYATGASNDAFEVYRYIMIKIVKKF